MKKQTPESMVLEGCLNYLSARQIFHWRNSVGCVRMASGHFMHFGKVGSSDIIGVLPDGRALFVECKAPKGGRLSKEQKEFLDIAGKNGALCVVAKNWIELDEVLRDNGYSMKDMALFNQGGEK